MLELVSLDSSFLIDLLSGEPSAVTKAADLDRRGEPKRITPAAAAEVLAGAYYVGGAYLDRTRTLIDALPLLPFDRAGCHEAARLGAELARRGHPLGKADLYVAAVTVRHGERLLTRDRAFSAVPGLIVESY